MARLWNYLCKCMWSWCGVDVEKSVENYMNGLFCCFYCEKPSRLAEKFFLFVKNKTVISGKQKQGILVGVSTVSTVST